jgi:putative hydrolase of the HAD superfamily
MSSLIKAIIFDLDNCLAPAKQLSEEIYMPPFKAMRAANKGALSEDDLTKAFADCWRHPLDWVASHYGFSAEMLKAGWDEFSKIEIKEPIYSYEDLAILAEFPTKKYLVTSGFRKLQESKINLLGLKKLFDKIYVDALGEPNRLGKKGLFELIMRENGFSPGEMLVVGDNSDSEIEAGNLLGVRTVQTLRPEVPKGENATFYVKDLIELKNLYIQKIAK